VKEPAQDEPELIEKLKQSDFAAFDIVYKRYAETVKRFLDSLTNESAWAEDAVQQVFLNLYRMRERLKPDQSLKTLLYVIAKNLFISHRRKKKAESIESINLYDGICANERVEPDVSLLNGYRRQCIRRAIASLPQSHLLVFVLAQYEDMKYEEIAALLGIPLGTVKSRMSNAMKRLREILKEEL